jgi:hypothetical protein
MLRRIARTTILALGVVCGLCGDQQNVPDSITYASFFGQVAQVKSGATVLLNGQDNGLIQPSVRELMGLTFGEAEILRALAIRCNANIAAFDAAFRPLLLEVRLELMDSAEARLRQRLNDIEHRRNQIVRACVDELRVEFGEARFEVIRRYIGSRKSPDFFPPISR